MSFVCCTHTPHISFVTNEVKYDLCSKCCEYHNLSYLIDLLRRIKKTRYNNILTILKKYHFILDNYSWYNCKYFENLEFHFHKNLFIGSLYLHENSALTRISFDSEHYIEYHIESKHGGYIKGRDNIEFLSNFEDILTTLYNLKISSQNNLYIR